MKVSSSFLPPLQNSCPLFAKKTRQRQFSRELLHVSWALAEIAETKQADTKNKQNTYFVLDQERVRTLVFTFLNPRCRWFFTYLREMTFEDGKWCASWRRPGETYWLPCRVMPLSVFIALCYNVRSLQRQRIAITRCVWNFPLSCTDMPLPCTDMPLPVWPSTYDACCPPPPTAPTLEQEQCSCESNDMQSPCASCTGAFKVFVLY